jgi:uncharacterized protein YdhG (YjbR/CyaY superfamily)
MKNKNSRTLKSGGVPKYIAHCPKEIQSKLRDIRAAIRSVAPNAIETLSYFDMPGYSYGGYAYNGMFAWFSYKAPYIRLHVRPNALLTFKKELAGYMHSKNSGEETCKSQPERYEESGQMRGYGLRGVANFWAFSRKA